MPAAPAALDLALPARRPGGRMGVTEAVAVNGLAPAPAPAPAPARLMRHAVRDGLAAGRHGAIATGAR